MDHTAAMKNVISDMGSREEEASKPEVGRLVTTQLGGT